MVSNFIAELIGGANEIDRLGPQEQWRLLERSSHTIQDMIAQLDNVVDHRARGTAEDLRNLASMIAGGHIPKVLVAHSLLEAADAIRRLKLLGAANSGNWDGVGR